MQNEEGASAQEIVTQELIFCNSYESFSLFQVINEATIPKINAKIVCGAANNQLGKPNDNKLMAERGITYVVDFLCNRMVSCFVAENFLLVG